MIPDRAYIQDAIDYAASRGAEFVEFYFERSFVHTICCEDRRVERISSGTEASGSVS